MSDDTAQSTVRKQIVDAFSSRVPPSEAVIESSVDDVEARDLRAAFAGLHWQDVDAHMVAEFKDALPLFTPHGFAYFLPAYLIACLDAPGQVDTALDAAVFNLTPPSSRQGWRWMFFESRASQFDQAEARAIEGFLTWEAGVEAAGWAAVGNTPPPERFGRALAFWKKVVDEYDRR